MPDRIEELATAQLAAYNRADLDGFVACYHPDVAVWQGETLQLRGRAAFREAYAAKFAAGGFGATVDARVLAGAHCVEREHWWVDGAEGRSEGTILVRYTVADDLIAVVQFLRA